MKEKEWKRWLFWFSLIIASIFVYKTIDSVSVIFVGLGNLISLLMPFIIAIIVSYVLYKPIKMVENKLSKVKFLNKASRKLSVLIVYVLLIILIVSIFKFAIPVISKNIVDLAYSLPGYYDSAIKYFENQPEDSIFVKINIVETIRSLEKVDIGKWLIDVIDLKNISNILKGISGVTSVVFNTFVVVVVSIYLLLERDDIKSFVKNVGKAVLNGESYKKYRNYYEKTNGIFFNFISSQIIDAFIVGILCTIVLTIMKVKYGMLLGFMIGLFNIIPYFGAIVAVTIATIITIFTGGLPQAIWMLIIVLIISQVDANVINPRILGTSLNLSPILIIFSVTIGGAYFSVLGMFLAVPIVAFFKIIIEDKINNRLKEKEQIAAENNNNNNNELDNK